MSVDHYENFPVASVLCPPSIRPAVVAIYRFARAADDLADEGEANAEQRRADLRQYQEDLAAIYEGRPPSARWAAVFQALDEARLRFGLPRQPLADLLDAFVQDTGNPLYDGRQQLLDYCRRSANPVGRLLLHLYAIDDETARRQSDAICTALQLINFWQDLGVDLPRGRIYLPLADARAHGIRLPAPAALVDDDRTRGLLRDLCAWAEALMRTGAPLALRVPGRAGWELRLVVQGGLRILDKIRAQRFATIGRRPRLGAWDLPVLMWRAIAMRDGAAPAGSRA